MADEIITQIKKGQIKRKAGTDASTGKQIIQILKPQTDADIVLYEGTINGTAVHNVDDAIDQLILGTGVNDVKIQVDSGTATTIVNNHVATIPVTSSYSGTSETIVNGKAIKAALDTLDVSEFALTETNNNIVTLHGIKEDNGAIAVGNTAANDVTFYNKTGTDNAITAAINGLDVSDFSLASTNTTTNVITLSAIKEVDGEIAKSTDTTKDVTFYNKTGADNAISAAINALDTSSNVAPAVVSGSGDAQKITFKDINETDGIIAAGSNITNAVTYTDGAIDTLLGTKVDKLTSGNKVYVHNGSTQTDIAYGTAATASNIVQRDSDGQIIVPETPTADSHAASKKYVDSKITQGAEYLGTVSAATGADSPQAKFSTAGVGDWCRATASFEYWDASTGANTTVHVGDILINTNATASATTWDVIHTEVDTDTNTTYKATVGAGSSATGDVYAGAIQLQYQDLGSSTWTNNAEKIKLINGNGITITPDTTNGKLTIGHSNSTTAQTTAKVFKTAIDAQGHITSSTEAYANDVGVTLNSTATSGVTSNADVLKVSNTSSDSKEVHIVTTDTAQTITGQKTIAYSNKLTFASSSPSVSDPTFKAGIISAGGPAVELTGTGLIVSNLKMSGGFYTPDNGNARLLLPDTTD